MKNFALELTLKQRRKSPIMGGLGSRLLSWDVRARHMLSSISSARGDFRRKELRNCTELWVGRKCFQHTANMVVQSTVVAFRLSLFFYQQVFPDNFMRREILSLVVHCVYVELGCKWKGEVRHLEVRLSLVCRRWKSALLENKLYAWFRQYEDTTFQSSKTVYEQSSVHPYDPQRLLRPSNAF